MSLSYEPLWQMLYELNVSKMEFAKAIGISNATLAKIGKNEPITLTIVDKICNEFECEIEDVVKHIPDVLLNQQKSDLPLNVGCIVQTNHFKDSHNEKAKTNIQEQPYVILEIKETIINSITVYQYMAAPISDTPTHYLAIYFENVSINGKLSHGWISLEKLQNIPSEDFIKILGKIPDKITKRTEKFLNSVRELLDENTL